MLEKKHSFLQVFEVCCSCFQNPLFLMLAFPFFGFVFVCFLLYFLLLFDKSSCYVLVFVSVVLGFLGFVMCYLLDFFGVLFLLFVIFGGFKGQVRSPKGPPHLALNPPYLFSLVFGLFLVCFWFVFCLFFVSFLFVLFSLFGFVSSLFLLLVFWKGLRVQVRLPEGPPHLATNPP